MSDLRTVHSSSAAQSWASSLRSSAPKDVKPPAAWVSGVVKSEPTPFKHSKRLSITEAPTAPPTTINVDASAGGRKHDNELRPVDWVGGEEKFSWERTLRSSTQPKPVQRRQPDGVKYEDRPWRSSGGKGTRSAPATMPHTREPSMARSEAQSVHSRQASGAVHSRKSSVAHSRRQSMAHSRRSTRASIRFNPDQVDEILESEIPEEAEPEQLEPAPEPELAPRDFLMPEPVAVIDADGPQAVKGTLAGSMLVEQAELISSMTVKQVVEQLATGTTVFKAWVRGQKQRGSTRHVKARVANDLVLLQYPSGFSKRQMTVIVSSIYVTVEPSKTVLTLETDNGTLVLKPYTPEHATLWTFGFNALLHLADKQGMLDENTVISDLPWHGIFQSPKDAPLAEDEPAAEAAPTAAAEEAAAEPAEPAPAAAHEAVEAEAEAEAEEEEPAPAVAAPAPEAEAEAEAEEEAAADEAMSERIDA